MKRNNSKSIITTYLVVFLVVRIIQITIEFFKNGKHLIYNAKVNGLIGWILLVILLIVLIWSIIQIFKIFKSEKSKIKLLRFIIAGALSLSFILSIFQYRLYVHKPDSYLIEAKVTDYYIKNKSTQIDNLIADFENEISTLLCIKNSISDSLLKTTFIEKRNLKIDSNNKYPGYVYRQDSINIYFREYDSGQPELPPIEGKKILEIFKLGTINVVKSSIDIEIIINKSNGDYFDLIESNIDSVKLLYFNNIIDVYIKAKKNTISLLTKNEKQILKTGLPFWVFLTNTFQISIGGTNDYIPLSWSAKFIELFQKILAFLIFIPLFGELYLYFKNKMTNEN